jgi:GIY-YIG catalytic domain
MRQYKYKITGNTNIEVGKCYLYILYDPTFVSKTFYAGKSENPKNRLNGHFSEAIEDNKSIRKNNWIKKVAKRNVNIEMYIVCEVPSHMTWQEAEKTLIAFLKWCGVRLANRTPGGDGGHVHTKKEKKQRSQRFSDAGNPKYKHEIDNNIILQKHYEGKSPIEIAEEMNINYNLVCRRLNIMIKNGLLDKINIKPKRHIYTDEMRRAKSIEVRGRRSKLTEENIFHIYKLVADGCVTDDILLIYPFVNRSTINRVINGKNWGYLLDEASQEIKEKIINIRRNRC